MVTQFKFICISCFGTHCWGSWCHFLGSGTKINNLQLYNFVDQIEHLYYRVSRDDCYWKFEDPFSLPIQLYQMYKFSIWSTKLYLFALSWSQFITEYYKPPYNLFYFALFYFTLLCFTLLCFALLWEQSVSGLLSR